MKAQFPLVFPFLTFSSLGTFLLQLIPFVFIKLGEPHLVVVVNSFTCSPVQGSELYELQHLQSELEVQVGVLNNPGEKGLHDVHPVLELDVAEWANSLHVLAECCQLSQSGV